MTDTKPLFRSKTFWGAAVAVLGALAGLFGIEITAADQAELTGLTDRIFAAWDSLAVIAGALLAIYGRVTARQKIR
ncbi:hypothetical protein GCM10011316_29120 [Roseibium aquae]|uniref:Uncharacterized protein n=1 Tax=Roseibium aquae TaxID=1323746 RepID=A0A916TL53_9HYPH|nr:hypothetical protein [Roseibium aquae]GGB55233.1 hypothetical protein GCM10011316_29120 [Roseibium aquae]